MHTFRCPVTNKDVRCVEVPDPKDPCCKKVLCDVTLDENEPEKEEEKIKRKVISAKFINATSVLVKFDTKLEDNETYPVAEISDDQHNWKNFKISSGGYITLNSASGAKYLRLEHSEDIITIQNQGNSDMFFDKAKDGSKGCQYKGRSFKFGEEYNDDCVSLCVCQNTGMKCLKIQCPTYFGVDVLDPNCVEWETVPPDFKPSTPNCCPESITCKNNGSCTYEGRTFKNWEQLPANVTGCENRCYCEMGKVECQNTCPPVTALPPPNLPCPPSLDRKSVV